jgi:hypothetical protein
MHVLPTAPSPTTTHLTDCMLEKLPTKGHAAQFEQITPRPAPDKCCRASAARQPARNALHHANFRTGSESLTSVQIMEHNMMT